MATFPGHLLPFGAVVFTGTATVVSAPVWVTTTTVQGPVLTLGIGPLSPGAWVTTTAVSSPALTVADVVFDPPAWVTTTSIQQASIATVTNVVADVWVTTTAVSVPSVATRLSAGAWASSTTVSGPVVAGPLTAPVWTPSTAIQLPTKTGPVTAPAWVPTTNFPTALLAGPLTAVPWVSSTVVQTPSVPALVSAPAWAATTTIFTPATQSTLLPGPWVASTAIQVAVIRPVISVPAWTSTTSVAAPVIAGPLIVPLWSSTTNVFEPASIRRFVDLTIAPNFGATDGESALVLSGTALDMSPCLPNFSDGALDVGFWTNLSTGSGEVLEVADAQALRLNTGTTANSVAGVRTVDQAANVDIEVQATSLVADVIAQSSIELALYVDSTTDLRLTVLNGVVSLRVRENGQTLADLPVGTTAGTPQLRLLRSGTLVYVFLGGTLVTTANWVASLANIELQARNNATATSQVATRVTRYLRRPVIEFDTSPVLNVNPLVNAQALAVAPARKIPGAVDVRITGCTTVVDTIPSGFTYALDPARPRVLNIPNGGRLTFLSDPAVTGRINGRNI